MQQRIKLDPVAYVLLCGVIALQVYTTFLRTSDVDSIITAIGMAQDLPVMITAVILAVIVMYAASGPVSGFIMRHPTTKVLALAFLVLIGVALVADGFGFHIPRGYVYSAMGFAALVEVINVVAGRKRRARLAERRLAGEGPEAGGP